MNQKIDEWDVSTDQYSEEDWDFYWDQIILDKSSEFPYDVIDLKQKNYTPEELEKLLIVASACASIYISEVNQIDQILTLLIDRGICIADHSERVCKQVFADASAKGVDKDLIWDAAGRLIVLLQKGLKVDVAQKYYDYLVEKKILISPFQFFYRHHNHTELLQECGLDLRGIDVVHR